MRFLLNRGHDVTPVNLQIAGQEVRGRVVAGSLAEAGPLAMVHVFRASRHVSALVDDAIWLEAYILCCNWV